MTDTKLAERIEALAIAETNADAKGNSYIAAVLSVQRQELERQLRAQEAHNG